MHTQSPVPQRARTHARTHTHLGPKGLPRVHQVLEPVIVDPRVPPPLDQEGVHPRQQDAAGVGVLARQGILTCGRVLEGLGCRF